MDARIIALTNASEQLFGPTLTEAFIRCVGISPVGSSLAELDHGALRAVLGSEPGARLMPTMLLVPTPDGSYYDKRVLVDRALHPCEGGSGRYVRRAVNPAHYDIDIVGIV